MIERQGRETAEDALDARRAELQPVADDLHDGLIQQLTAAKLILESSLRDLRVRSRVEHAEGAEASNASGSDAPGDLSAAQAFAERLAELEQVRELLGDCLSEARALLDQLQSVPNLSGSRAAIEQLARRLSPLVTVQVDIDPAFDELTDVERMLLLRAVQTLLGNVIRHSGANEARVTARVEGDQRWLEVCDNGLGWDRNACQEGHGISALRRRLRRLQGTLHVEHLSQTDQACGEQAGRGCQVRLEWQHPAWLQRGGLQQGGLQQGGLQRGGLQGEGGLQGGEKPESAATSPRSTARDERC